MASSTSNISKFNFGVPAIYTDPLVPGYRGNPLIEALPKYHSPDTVLGKLAFLPAVDPNIQSLPAEIAIHFLQSFDQFFQPNGLHVALEQKISIALRKGHITHNPIYPQYWRGIEQYLHPKNQFNSTRKKVLTLDAKTTSFALVAPTGVGKTISTLRILRLLYDQIIVHTSYEDRVFYFTQLVWLYVQCPSDGSLKGLCFNILHAIDALIGGDHYTHYSRNGRASKDEMKGHIKNLSRRYGLGILVLDEFSNLIDADINNQEDVINFLIELDNILSLPIMIIGTLKSLSLLQWDLQLARRNDAEGSAIWGRMERQNIQKGFDGKTWTTFIRELSKCQVLPIKKKIEEEPELEDALYDEAQGIPDLVVKLFLFAQARALLACQQSTGQQSAEQQSLTPELIRSVALDSLQLARPILTALRTNDIEALKQLDDMPIVSVEEFIQNALKTYQIQSEAPIDSKSETPDNINTSPQAMAQPKKSIKNQKNEVNYSVGDLRLLLQDAKKHKIAPHTAFSEAGILFSIYDAIPQKEKK